MGILYVVPTPIGNLEDMTLRALRVLKDVALIAAEDTRTSRILLQHYEIRTPLTSYHEHNKLSKLDTIFQTLESSDVALVSDAGMPGISDPGYELVREAIERGYKIVPLPGANATITALVGSGLPTDRFLFLGFLPRKQQALQRFLETVADEPGTLIINESPNRLVATLESALSVLGDRQACVARELSKVFEEFQRGTLSVLHRHYEANPPRGEITLLIGGRQPEAPRLWDENHIREALQERLQQSEPLSKAAKAVARESGWERRAVYTIGLGLQNDPSKNSQNL